MKKFLYLFFALLITACRSSAAAAPDSTLATQNQTVDKVQPVNEALTETVHIQMLNRLARASKDREQGRAVLTEIEATGDTRFVAGLLDLMAYDRRLSGEISVALTHMTGATETVLDWHDWMEWLGRHPEVESFPGYDVWKADILAKAINPGFRRFIYPGIKTAAGARLEEIVWGGIRPDGITALDNPPMIAAREADYLWPEEQVFGVSINGDTRAYPARFLDWHEMANDVVGGVPVSLAYCTLCGSAVLYETTIDESQLPPGYDLSGGQGEFLEIPGYFTFGSSGLLYQSNKLMYDRHTDTLWQQLLGRPAFGKLVGSGIELERLPVTLTTWESWLAQHPESKVMALDPDSRINYTPGAAYGDYFASEYTMFPVAQRSQILPAKSWVFIQLINGQAKAYPLSTLETERVVNDSLAGQNLVVIYEDGGLGGRAYDRGDHTFASASPDTTQVLLDETGGQWETAEEALISEGGAQLARLPGHMSFWFGWFSFYPGTEVYGLDN